MTLCPNLLGACNQPVDWVCRWQASQIRKAENCAPLFHVVFTNPHWESLRNNWGSHQDNWKPTLANRKVSKNVKEIDIQGSLCQLEADPFRASQRRRAACWSFPSSWHWTGSWRRNPIGHTTGDDAPQLICKGRSVEMIDQRAQDFRNFTLKLEKPNQGTYPTVGVGLPEVAQASWGTGSLPRVLCCRPQAFHKIRGGLTSTNDYGADLHLFFWDGAPLFDSQFTNIVCGLATIKAKLCGIGWPLAVHMRWTLASGAEHKRLLWDLSGWMK